MLPRNEVGHYLERGLSTSRLKTRSNLLFQLEHEANKLGFKNYDSILKHLRVPDSGLKQGLFNVGEIQGNVGSYIGIMENKIETTI